MAVPFRKTGKTRKRKRRTHYKISANETTKCPNCGASVDVKNGYCEYCNSKIGYLQEWIIED